MNIQIIIQYLFIVFTSLTVSDVHIPDTPINLWCNVAPIVDSISTTNDTHYYKFRTTNYYSGYWSQNIITFSTCNNYTTSLNTEITLYDDHMTKIASNDDAEPICFGNSFASSLIFSTAVSYSTYYLSVSYSGIPEQFIEAQYGIQVSCVPNGIYAKYLGCSLTYDDVYGEVNSTYILDLYTINHHNDPILDPKDLIIRTDSKKNYRLVLYDENFTFIGDSRENASVTLEYTLNSPSFFANYAKLYLFITSYPIPYDDPMYNINYHIHLDCLPINGTLPPTLTSPPSFTPSSAPTNILSTQTLGTTESNCGYNVSALYDQICECDTVKDGQICIISRNHSEFGFPRYYIVCDPQYQHCVVSLTNANAYIACPATENCQMCTVKYNLAGYYGEQTIDAGECSVVVDIENGIINGPFLSSVGNLVHNVTVNVATNASLDGIDYTFCRKNCDTEPGIINGSQIQGVLTVNCYGSCRETQIICPINPIDVNSIRCNINCYDSCDTLNVMTFGGMNDVNWFCDDQNSNACINSQLHCKDISYGLGDLYSTWIYNDDTWQLDNDNCNEISITSPVVTKTYERVVHVIDNIENPVTIGAIAGSLFVVLIIIVFGLVYYYKYQREKKSVYISNALVILISIGLYDDEPTKPEIEGNFRDLNGVKLDVKNMIKLFHAQLEYDVYPSEYFEDENNIREYWTEEQLKNFLLRKAAYLENNITENKKYDGLILILSCHGVPGYIITSDIKKFSKLAIHRIFSENHPQSREIPRVFLYDCCSGANEQVLRRQESEDDSLDKGKAIQMAKCVENDDEQIALWVHGERNPDYRLAVIEAANPGFQSKLRSDRGSYVIYGFFERIMTDLKTNKGRKFIHEIFDDVQTYLQDQGKQHPTYTWNDGTAYIRFKRNDIHSNDIQSNDKIELQMIEQNKNHNENKNETESDFPKENKSNANKLMTRSVFVLKKVKEANAGQKSKSEPLLSHQYNHNDNQFDKKNITKQDFSDLTPVSIEDKEKNFDAI